MKRHGEKSNQGCGAVASALVNVASTLVNEDVIIRVLEVQVVVVVA